MRAACAETDRLENFLSALFELKYSISHIEKKHPFLGTELSSLCEETISRLSWPPCAETEVVAMEPARLPLPVGPVNMPPPEPTPAQMPSVTGQAGIPVIESPQPVINNNNRVVYSLDAAGGILITVLDKMGDGIIMAFEKLLSLGPKGRKPPPVVEI